MPRPSNRELKVLSAALDGVTSPEDFKDIGEKTFDGLVKKGWIVAVPKGGYTITDKGRAEHQEELYYGRFKR